MARYYDSRHWRSLCPEPRARQEAELDSGHLPALAKWLDTIKAELAGIETAPLVMTVEHAELPGAMAVKVSPDLNGVRTSTSLIKWANPRIALLVPGDNGASFWLFLDGDQDRVVIYCGPPWFPPLRDEMTYEEIDPEEAERIAQQLIDVANQLFTHDPEWHPSTALVRDPEFLVDAYLTQHPEDDRAAVRTVAELPEVMSPPLLALQEQRQSQHQRRWVADAGRIAQELLDGDDGPMLRRNTKNNIVIAVRDYLKNLDPVCAERPAAEAIASTIREISKRRPSPQAKAEPAPAGSWENPMAIDLSNSSGTK